MDKWDKVAEKICHPGIRAKFLQNPAALDTLLIKNRMQADCGMYLRSFIGDWNTPWGPVVLGY